MDLSSRLKAHLESVFSMPFDVESTHKDGEIRYTCYPSNEDAMFFNVSIYIHNHIRLIIDITPQKHGRNILNEMALATNEKKCNFFNYIDYLKEKKIRFSFKVNGEELTTLSEWPSVWRDMSCKITKLPIPDIDQDDAEFIILSEWTQDSFELLFTLLTIGDIIENEAAVQKEGTQTEIRSIRYERNPINRKICLQKKGYVCAVCGMNFYDMYGKIGKEYIEVHHTTPVSEMPQDYILDIERDLVPLCSNCHSMAHRCKPPFSVSELKRYMEEQTCGTGLVAEPQSEYGVQEKKDLIIGVVKSEMIRPFLNHEAKLYYFGKHFPSKYNLKEIKYFAPYFNGGIRGYYDVLAIRTARKSEIDGQGDIYENDIRIMLDLGDYHHMSDSPQKVPLANYNHAFLLLKNVFDKKTP